MILTLKCIHLENGVTRIDMKKGINSMVPMLNHHSYVNVGKFGGLGFEEEQQREGGNLGISLNLYDDIIIILTVAN